MSHVTGAVWLLATLLWVANYVSFGRWYTLPFCALSAGLCAFHLGASPPVVAVVACWTVVWAMFVVPKAAEGVRSARRRRKAREPIKQKLPDFSRCTCGSGPRAIHASWCGLVKDDRVALYQRALKLHE